VYRKAHKNTNERSDDVKCVTIQRRWGLNFSYCPLWENLNFIVPLNACSNYSALRPVAHEEVEDLTVHIGRYKMFQMQRSIKFGRVYIY
jgi:hypothetical protein